MSWQEELRRIDSDLAAGKLTKDQYALKREELLARASSASDIPDEPALAAETATTRVPAEELLHTERATSAPSPADERPTDSMPHPKRPGQTTPAPSAMEQREIPPPVPPRTLEPRAAAPTSEPFPEPVPRGTGPTLTFLALGVVLVVALVAAGLWWLASGEADPAAGANPPSAGTTSPTTKYASPAPTPPTQSTIPAELVDRLPELPGTLLPESGVHTMAEVADRNLVGKGEQVLLKKRRVSAVTWKGSVNKNYGVVIVVAENDTTVDATKTTQAWRKHSARYSEHVMTFPMAKRLPVFRSTASDTTVLFSVYRSGRNTIQVSVTRSTSGQPDASREALRDLLGEVFDVLAPDQ